MPQEKKSWLPIINKETERFYLTNLIAFEIFLLVSIFALAQVNGVSVSKEILPPAIVIGTIGIGGILVMSVIKTDGFLITIFFLILVITIILSTLILVWALLNFIPSNNSAMQSNNSIHAHEHYNIFFQNNATHLNINVKAIAQTENSNLSSGYGPAYLLNGLTNNGYWYQVGLGYNFNYTDNKNVDNYSGFRLIYEVWNSYTNKQLNIGCGNQACVKNFIGVVNNNDTILLNMSIVGNNVILSAYDTNTTARSPTINITSYGASFFTSKPIGIGIEYFSGLMTEWRCIGETNFTQRSVYSIIYPKTNIKYCNFGNNETNNLCKSQPSNCTLIDPNENKSHEICGTQLYYYLNQSITINGSVLCPN